MVGVVIDRAIATGDTSALIGSLALVALLFVAISSAFRIGFRVISRAGWAPSTSSVSASPGAYSTRPAAPRPGGSPASC
jgi:hypothetical protein